VGLLYLERKIRIEDRGSNTVLMIPITACLEVVCTTDPAIDICEFNDAHFTIVPRWGTLPSSHRIILLTSGLQFAKVRKSRPILQCYPVSSSG
jgi:hypothetical protein